MIIELDERTMLLRSVYQRLGWYRSQQHCSFIKFNNHKTTNDVFSYLLIISTLPFSSCQTDNPEIQLLISKGWNNSLVNEDT